MDGFSVGGVGDLVATAKAAGDDDGVGGAGANGGEEAVLADLERHFVMFFFITEGAGHAAATGVDLGDIEAGELCWRI